MRDLMQKYVNAFGFSLIKKASFDKILAESRFKEDYEQQIKKLQGQRDSAFAELAAFHEQATARTAELSAFKTSFFNMANSAREENIAKYLSVYGNEDVRKRQFLNIGAGAWKHPAWQNVEFPTEWYEKDLENNIDIAWDATSKNSINVDSESINLVFVSHTTEHLLPEHNVHMFNEAFRVLKPGGYIRITCPNFHLYYGAYLRGDLDFFSYPSLVKEYPVEQVLVYEFASMLSECEPDQPGLKLTTDYIKHTLSSLPMEQALDEICSHVDYSRNRKKPNHVSWWTPEKLVRYLSAAGFEAYASAFGQSQASVMRDTGYNDPLRFLSGYFDTTIPRCSLYVEGRKPV